MAASNAIACKSLRASRASSPHLPLTSEFSMRCICWLTLLISSVLILNRQPALAKEVTTLEIDAPAPELDLPGVDGKTYQLKDFADADVLVVIFTCNHCPTAQAYEPRIIKLHDDYRDKGVAFVAISPNDPLAVRLDELGYTDVGDSFDDMKVHAKRRGFKFPYLYDGETQRRLHRLRRPRDAARVHL